MKDGVCKDLRNGDLNENGLCGLVDLWTDCSDGFFVGTVYLAVYSFTSLLCL